MIAAQARNRRRLAALALTAAAIAPAAARAKPMDLLDAKPRQVTVRFELSPPDRPAQTNTRYSAALPAWLEPGPLPETLQVTVKGSLVERHLMAGHEALAGTFSDFVWVFDTATGHVRSATLSGVVRQQVRIGLSSFALDMPIRVAMDTASPAGLEAPQSLFGHQLHRFCHPARSRSCREVQPRAYDPSTGYVNALGTVSADSKLVRIRSFSPLGEAVFSEAEPRLARGDTPSVSAAPARAAALLN